MGRPVWLKAPLDTGLVVADGELYRFALNNAVLTKVDVEGIAGPIADVGVAPDGRRIAVVAGGKAYVATVTREDGGVEVQGAQEVRAGLTDVTGVDWSGETKVVLAGRDMKEGRSRSGRSAWTAGSSRTSRPSRARSRIWWRTRAARSSSGRPRPWSCTPARTRRTTSTGKTS
nr:LpqB family beta-propeller domain-containing protein [Phytohabitans rumicis]